MTRQRAISALFSVLVGSGGGWRREPIPPTPEPSRAPGTASFPNLGRKCESSRSFLPLFRLEHATLSLLSPYPPYPIALLNEDLCLFPPLPLSLPLSAAIRLELSHDVEAVRAPDGNHQALCQLPRNRGLAEANGPVW